VTAGLEPPGPIFALRPSRPTACTEPKTRRSFEDYAHEWLEGYAGRTNRGFSKASRADYRRALDQHALPFFRGWKLADVEPRDVRRLVTELEAKGTRARERG